MNLEIGLQPYIWGIYVIFGLGGVLEGDEGFRHFYIACGVGLKKIVVSHIRFPGIGDAYNTGDRRPFARWLFTSWRELVAMDKAMRKEQAERRARDAEWEALDRRAA